MAHLRYDTRRPTMRRVQTGDAWHLAYGLAVLPRRWVDAPVFSIGVAMGTLILGAALTVPTIGRNVFGLVGVLALGLYQFAVAWWSLRTGYSSRDRMMLLLGELFVASAVASLVVVAVRALLSA